MLCLHGNGGNLSDRLAKVGMFRAAGAARGRAPGGHNEGFMDTGEAYGASIRDFLASLRKSPEAKRGFMYSKTSELAPVRVSGDAEV